MAEIKHTPWRYKTGDNVILDAQGEFVVCIGPTHGPNIVKVMNAHDDLVKALADIAEFSRQCAATSVQDGDMFKAIHERASTALAKVTTADTAQSEETKS